MDLRLNNIRRAGLTGLAILLILSLTGLCHAADIAVEDSAGNRIELASPPQRIVSLVPSASEILVAIGAKDQLAGTTFHDLTLNGAKDRGLAGGFFNPSLAHINALDPDFLIVSSLHKDLAQTFKATGVPVFVYDTGHLEDAWTLMARLGTITGQSQAARELVRKNRDAIVHIRAKLDRAHAQPLRVIRLMGKDQIMTPGKDSFQNDMIRAAGGIAPDFAGPGKIVTVTLDQWQAFDPQVIYGCDMDKQVADRFFSRPGWKDVSAVKNHRIYYLPCDLTCRASARTGSFIAGLSSMIYTPAFADEASFVNPVSKMYETLLDIDMPVVKKAAIVHSRILDFENKTLVVDLQHPTTVVSTLEGQRNNITTVGNHYSPPPAWLPGHSLGIDYTRDAVLTAIDRSKDHTAFLMTGADMDHVCVKTASFKDMKVTALVTAGVVSNAMRMGEDTGMWYEPGTINVIVLTNMQLSPRAMTRAIITATEAKTGVLQDLDIRSAYTGRINMATGTGTDNVLVVQGEGAPIDNSGGHTKMGELIARAVSAGVKGAIEGQNGLVAGRHVVQRLKERKISLYGLVSGAQCDCQQNKGAFIAMVEQLMLNPEYSGFLEAALSLSDAYEKGKVSNLDLFDGWCQAVAAKISGEPDIALAPLVQDDTIPVVVQKALNAIMTGARARTSQGA